MLAIAGVAALLWLERARPLRVAVEPGLRRVARNLAIAGMTAAAVHVIERPLTRRAAKRAEQHAWGIVPRLPLTTLRTAAAVTLMDYTLYWWHVLLHRVPWLWRLHAPHHIDRDLDASTGVRFHFAEFIASIPWRCAQIICIGVSPSALAVWQRLTLGEVLFHHANLRLPRRLERLLSAWIVTPRLHGLHHSVIRGERDSNYSSGLSVWDRVHGTARAALGRDDVTIGLPDRMHADKVRLGETLALPFRKRSSDAAHTNCE